jgi:hypothetical protein
MAAGLRYEKIRAKIDTNHWSAKMLAEVVCSTYWGSVGVDLRELDRLDAKNCALAVSITLYQRTTDWDDMKFYVLALWCRKRHHLDQWAKE